MIIHLHWKNIPLVDKHQRIAVKIVDDRGIESLKIVEVR